MGTPDDSAIVRTPVRDWSGNRRSVRLARILGLPLSASARNVYLRLWLYGRAANDGAIFVSRTRLAQDVRVTSSALQDCLTELWDADLVVTPRVKSIDYYYLLPRADIVAGERRTRAQGKCSVAKGTQGRRKGHPGAGTCTAPPGTPSQPEQPLCPEGDILSADALETKVAEFFAGVGLGTKIRTYGLAAEPADLAHCYRLDQEDYCRGYPQPDYNIGFQRLLKMPPGALSMEVVRLKFVGYHLKEYDRLPLRHKGKCYPSMLDALVADIQTTCYGLTFGEVWDWYVSWFCASNEDKYRTFLALLDRTRLRLFQREYDETMTERASEIKQRKHIADVWGYGKALYKETGDSRVKAVLDELRTDDYLVYDFHHKLNALADELGFEPLGFDPLEW